MQDQKNNNKWLSTKDAVYPYGNEPTIALNGNINFNVTSYSNVNSSMGNQIN